MYRLTRSTRRAAAIAALVLPACLLLVACGGSSGTSSSATASASAKSATNPPAGVTGAKRFSALRECLQKEGITLPKRTPGQRPQGGFLGGGSAPGPQLPKGVTRARYEAAVKKCGGFGAGRVAGAGAGQRFNSPAAKLALTRFATCMRAAGINVPTPNTSGKGPIFSTNGLNTASAKFKAAQTKCASDLRGVFRAQPGGAAAPPGNAG